MFQGDSAFSQQAEALRESIRQFEQGELDLTPRPESKPIEREASAELDFFLTEAAFGIERLASTVPGEFQGDLADVIAFIEEARNTVEKLDL
jgi:hypothetical protein